MRIAEAIRTVCVLLLAAAVVVFGPAIARAEKRVALVVGNSQYVKFPQLQNPRNDAAEVAAGLKAVGFDDIEVVNDADETKFRDALRRLARKATGADAVVFYYGGHGIEQNKTAYLLPVNVESADLQDIDFGPLASFSVEKVAQALSKSRGAKILIVDACRNDPMAQDIKVGDLDIRNVRSTRDLTPDMARTANDPDRDTGMMVVYSTSPDHVAYDGAGSNSPFAAAFVRHLKEPGLSVAELVERVRKDVDRETGGKQRTSNNSTLFGDYQLNRAESDETQWQRIKNSEDPREFDAFLTRFPASAHADEAKHWRDVLQRALDAQNQTRLAQEASCQAESSAINGAAARHDINNLEALKTSMTCPGLAPTIDKALAEVREYLAAAGCDAQRKQAAAAPDDLNALNALAPSMTCAPAVADLDARRKRAEAAAEQHRVACLSEQRRLDAAPNDVNALQKAIASFACPETIAAANARISQTRANLEACQNEAKDVETLRTGRDALGLRALRDRAKCAATSGAVEAALAAVEQLAKASACADDLKYVKDALWNFRPALRGFADDKAKCADARSLARGQADKLEADATKKARVCEDERGQIKGATGLEALRALAPKLTCDEAQSDWQKAFNVALAEQSACASEADQVDRAAADPAQLNALLPRLNCEASRKDAQGRIAKLRDEGNRLTQICKAAEQALSAVDTNDALSLKKLASIGDNSAACESVVALSKSEAETVAAKVRNIQTQLSRIGCYSGQASGVFDDKTKQALAAYYLNNHVFLTASASAGANVGDELLAKLRAVPDSPSCSPAIAPVASAPAPAPAPAPKAIAKTNPSESVTSHPVVHTPPKPKPPVSSVADAPPAPKPAPPAAAKPAVVNVISVF